MSEHARGEIARCEALLAHGEPTWSGETLAEHFWDLEPSTPHQPTYNIQAAARCPEPPKQDLSRRIEEHQVENDRNNQLSDSERYKFAMESQRLETEQLRSGEGARGGAGRAKFNGESSGLVVQCHPVPNIFDAIVIGLSLGVTHSPKGPSPVVSPVRSSCAPAMSPVPASAPASAPTTPNVGNSLAPPTPNVGTIAGIESNSLQEERRDRQTALLSTGSAVDTVNSSVSHSLGTPGYGTPGYGTPPCRRPEPRMPLLQSSMSESKDLHISDLEASARSRSAQQEQAGADNAALEKTNKDLEGLKAQHVALLHECNTLKQKLQAATQNAQEVSQRPSSMSVMKMLRGAVAGAKQKDTEKRRGSEPSLHSGSVEATHQASKSTDKANTDLQHANEELQKAMRAAEQANMDVERAKVELQSVKEDAKKIKEESEQMKTRAAKELQQAHDESERVRNKAAQLRGTAGPASPREQITKLDEEIKEYERIGQEVSRAKNDAFLASSRAEAAEKQLQEAERDFFAQVAAEKGKTQELERRLNEQQKLTALFSSEKLRLESEVLSLKEAVAGLEKQLQGKQEGIDSLVDQSQKAMAEQVIVSLQAISRKDQECKKATNRCIDTCKRAVKRMLRQQLSIAWISFQESVMQSKVNRETVHKVLKRMSRRSLALAFEGYSEAASTSVWQRENVAKVIARWTKSGLIKALDAWVDYVQLTRQVRTEEAKELVQSSLMSEHTNEQILIQELTNQVQKLTADVTDKDKAMDELQSVLHSKEQQLEQLLELLGKQDSKDMPGPPATAI